MEVFHEWLHGKGEGKRRQGAALSNSLADWNFIGIEPIYLYFRTCI